MIDWIDGDFIWDLDKEDENYSKHGVDFSVALKAFDDPFRKIYLDQKHNEAERRLFCIGKVGERILTVRYVRRGGRIRIFGAGYWRRGKRYYEEID